MVTLLVAAMMISVPQAAAPRCIDPATPLRELALSYDWPPPASPKTAEAFAQLQNYLRSELPSDYHDAELRYRGLLTVRPRDAHVQLALGLIYAIGPDLNFPESRGYRNVGLSNNALADDRAGRALGTAVALDSTQWLAAVALTRVALGIPEPARLKQAMEAVDRALAAAPTSVVLRLARYDLLIASRRYEEAFEVAESLPSNCTPARHALAEALMLRGQPAPAVPGAAPPGGCGPGDNDDCAGPARGAQLYWAALREAREGEVDRFEDDVRSVISIPQREALEQLDPEQRPAWLRHFWERSAALAGRSVEDRISDQFSRVKWSFANARRLSFPPSSDRPIKWLTDTIHRDPWLQNGLMNVRHGTPTTRLTAHEPFHNFQAWVYLEPDTAWVMLFEKARADDWTVPGIEWQFVERPSCTGSSFLARELPREDIEQRSDSVLTLQGLYILLGKYDPRFAELAHLCRLVVSGVRSFRAEEIQRELAIRNRRLWRDAAWSESGDAPYAERLRLFLAVYQFFDASRAPELASMLWVPTTQLRSTAQAGDSLRVTYAAADSLVGAVRLDAILPVPAQAEMPGLIRSAAIWRILPADTGQIRVVVRDTGDPTRGGNATAAFAVRRPPETIVLSDLVLAEATSDGFLVRGAARLSPLPTNSLRAGEPFRLYFEVYGLKADEQYQTRINVKRIDRSGLGPLRKLFPGWRADRELRFHEMAEVDERGVVTRDFTVGGDLLPGDYTITGEVVTRRGRSQQRTQLRVEDGAR